MNNWFSSDWHLGHEKILSLARRPYSNAQEMNNHILDIYKKTVKRGDNFYYLGDLAWKVDIIYDFFRKIFNYEKHHNFFWILGNHDLKFQNKLSNLPQLGKHLHIYNGIHEIKILDNEEKYRITLCHYPMITWNCSHFGAWQLYGHHHNDYSGDFQFLRDHNPSMGKQYNVAWDNNNYKFINFHEIKHTMGLLQNNWDLIIK
mgnify:CR=1 FL=1